MQAQQQQQQAQQLGQGQHQAHLLPHLHQGSAPQALHFTPGDATAQGQLAQGASAPDVAGSPAPAQGVPDASQAFAVKQVRRVGRTVAVYARQAAILSAGGRADRRATVQELPDSYSMSQGMLPGGMSSWLPPSTMDTSMDAFRRPPAA